MHSSLMHIYRTAKVDITEYFRAESSQFMSGMRMTVAQEIHTRGE